MSTTTPITVPHAGEHGAASPQRRGPSRLWAYAGLAAGVLGIGAIQASLRVDAVYVEAYAGDAEAIRDRLADNVPAILTFHTLMLGATVLLLVFAAGLRRRLAAQAPAGSLLPEVAASGLWLSSVAGLMGTAFTTESVFGLADGGEQLVPEMAVVFGHWIGTVPWLWLGAGVTGIAVAAAALRHAAAPRWLGWVSAVLGGLTLVTGLSPLQYMAGFFGPVFVLVAAAGFAFGDRERRRA